MNLYFCGTGHWSSRKRRQVALLLTIGGQRLLFECPGDLQLPPGPPPDFVFITHAHHFSQERLYELVQAGTRYPGLGRGASTGLLSVRSFRVSHGTEPTVGFAVYLGSTKLLAFAPDYHTAPDALFDGALVAVVDGCRYADSFYRHPSDSAQQSQMSRCGVSYVLLTHISSEPAHRWARVPSDGEVITVTEYPALQFEPSQAQAIAADKLSLIVLPRLREDLVGPPLYICDRTVVYAKVALGQPHPLSLAQFRARQAEHGLSDRERRLRWPGVEPLYAYPFVVLQAFDPPLRHQGRFTDGFAPGLLLRDPEPPTILSAIQDLDSYDPRDYTPQQRLDDFRLMSAHYANSLRGRRTSWPPELLLRQGLRLARYMAEHDGVVFHPDQMKPAARAFFYELLKRDPSLPHTLSDEELAISAPQLRRLPKEQLAALARNLVLTWRAGRRDEPLCDLVRLVRRLRAAPSAIPPLTLVPDGISLCGSLVYGLEPHDIDILTRVQLPPGALAPLAGLFDLPLHVFCEPSGPNWDYVPLGDLVIAAECPASTVRSTPPNLTCLEGLASYVVWPGFLSREGNSFLVPIPQHDGLRLKLERLFPEADVVFDATAAGEPVADLWFVPYERLEVRSLPWDRDFMSRLYAVSLSAALRPGQPFTPLKARTGYHVGEFYTPDDLIAFWATDDRLRRGIVVQPKADGIRLVLHRRGSKVWIFTEDRKRDRARVLPMLVKALQELRADSVILDAEVLEYHDGSPVPRHEMVELVVSNSPPQHKVVAWVHDCLYLNGEDLSGKPYTERLEQLASLSLSGSLRPMPWRLVHTADELREALRWAASFSEAASEGAMVKVADSPYRGERSEDWAKLKLAQELKVMVIGVQRKPNPWPRDKKPDELSGPAALDWYRRLSARSQTYLIRGAIRGPRGLIPIEADHVLTPGDLHVRWSDGQWRGTSDPQLWEMHPDFPHRKAGELAYGVTYAKRLDPPPKIGDIVTVRPMEVRLFQHNGSNHIAWMFPTLVEVDPERREPDSWDDVLRLVRFTKARHEVSAGERVPLTRDEMRELAKKRLGFDWYVVKQPPHKTFPFVLQYHLRGILDPERLKLASRIEGDPAEHCKRFGLVYLIADRQTIARELQKADDERGDVSGSLRQFFATEIPDRPDLDRLCAWGNVHADLRLLHPDGHYLVGWTNDIVKVVLQFLDGELFFPLRSRILQNAEGDLWLAQQKATQPTVWLELVSPKRTHFWRPPGSVGATKNTSALFLFAASGRAVYGVQKSEHYHEYFLRFDSFGPVAHHDPDKLSGRWDFKLIEGDDRSFWQGSRPWRTQAPYITTHDLDEESRKEHRAGRQFEWNSGALSALAELLPGFSPSALTGHFTCSTISLELQTSQSSQERR